MEYQNIKFRATFFPDNEVVMDEQWIANANAAMSGFRLVPSVGSTFKINDNANGGMPSFSQFYSIEFKKFDDSFKITLLPFRFDIERRVSDPSVSSPIKDFVKDVTAIMEVVMSLQPSYSRVALAATIEIELTGEEREKLTESEFKNRPQSVTPTEFVKRNVGQTPYEVDAEGHTIRMNEVVEISTPDISNHGQPIAVGFDFNSIAGNSVDDISRHLRALLDVASRHISEISEKESISALFFN